jgi:hypothetical protein
VTAGIDLALALVEDDHGPDLTPATSPAPWWSICRSASAGEVVDRQGQVGEVGVAVGLDQPPSRGDGFLRGGRCIGRASAPANRVEAARSSMAGPHRADRDRRTFNEHFVVLMLRH